LKFAVRSTEVAVGSTDVAVVVRSSEVAVAVGSTDVAVVVRSKAVAVVVRSSEVAVRSKKYRSCSCSCSLLRRM
jgi:hypothetical protein